MHAVRAAYCKPYGWAVTALHLSNGCTIGQGSNVQMLIGSTACHWDWHFLPCFLWHQPAVAKLYSAGWGQRKHVARTSQADG